MGMMAFFTSQYNSATFSNYSYALSFFLDFILKIDIEDYLVFFYFER